MSQPSRVRTLQITRWIVAFVFLFAGASKFWHPEQFGILRLVGYSGADPAWWTYGIAAFEICIAVLLAAIPSVGTYFATGMSILFSLYHIGIGFGIAAPT